jgi:hypothetical protein
MAAVRSQGRAAAGAYAFAPLKAQGNPSGVKMAGYEGVVRSAFRQRVTQLGQNRRLQCHDHEIAVLYCRAQMGRRAGHGIHRPAGCHLRGEQPCEERKHGCHDG